MGFSGGSGRGKENRKKGDKPVVPATNYTKKRLIPSLFILGEEQQVSLLLSTGTISMKFDTTEGSISRCAINIQQSTNHNVEM